MRGSRHLGVVTLFMLGLAGGSGAGKSATVEGYLALYDSRVRKFFDLCIYLDAPAAVHVARRNKGAIKSRDFCLTIV